MIPLPAYIDPSSGSLIIQAVIAAVVAIPILLRSQVARALQTLRDQGNHKPAGEDDAAARR
jgi:hypothetical protein